MKKRKFSREDLLSLCGSIHPQDGIDPRYDSDSNDSLMSRKLATGRHRALGATIQKVLIQVLSSEIEDDLLAGLQVIDVEPLASGRWRVLVLLPIAFIPFRRDVIERLRALKPFLRQEVAATVKRSRAPDFHFDVVATTASEGVDA